MRSQIKLGKIAGTRVGLHYTGVLVAFVIIFSLMSAYHRNHPQWSCVLTAVLATTCAALYLICLVAHEVAHAVVARAQKLRVYEMTLFALGGISQLDGEAETPLAEISMSAAGPAVNAIIGLTCLAAVHSITTDMLDFTPWMAMFSTLGYLNLGLAMFGLAPCYPMDGGRILRALIWWQMGDVARATRDGVLVSKVVAVLVMAGGGVYYFSGHSLMGMWIVFAGLFLLQASRETYLEMSFRGSMAGMAVRDLMVRDFLAVDGRKSIQDLLDQTTLNADGPSYLVTIEGNAVGLVTPKELRSVSPADWPVVTLDAVMRPLCDVVSVTPEVPLFKAIQMMGQEGLAQLPVFANGHLQGILSREELLEYIATITEPRVEGH